MPNSPLQTPEEENSNVFFGDDTKNVSKCTKNMTCNIPACTSSQKDVESNETRSDFFIIILKSSIIRKCRNLNVHCVILDICKTTTIKFAH